MRSFGQELPFLLTYTQNLRIGQVARPTEQLYFRNPYRGPFWVDELHFTSQNPGVESTIPQGVYALRLKLNDRLVVEDYIPFTLLAPKTDQIENNQAAGGSGGDSFFWRLSKPLWIDEKDDFSIELTWLGNLNIYDNPSAIGNNTAALSVELCGRASKNALRPQQRFLPFVAVWGPNTYVTDPAEEQLIISPDSALINTRNTPVQITRMLGFCENVQGTDVAEVITSNAAIQLRMSHSKGYYVIKDAAPFYELFQNESRSAAFKFVLQPKEFVTIEVQNRPIEFVVEPTDPTDFQYFMGYSLQGYSVEPLGALP